MHLKMDGLNAQFLINPQPQINNTDYPIAGSDYVIIKEETIRYEKDDIPYNWDWRTQKYTIPGKKYTTTWQNKRRSLDFMCWQCRYGSWY